VAWPGRGARPAGRWRTDPACRRGPSFGRAHRERARPRRARWTRPACRPRAPRPPAPQRSRPWATGPVVLELRSDLVTEDLDQLGVPEVGREAGRPLVSTAAVLAGDRRYVHPA